MRVHHPERDLRVPLGSVDDETARGLIAEHQPIISAQVRRFSYVAATAFHPVDREDLVALAETAVLEAYVTYREGDVARERTPKGGLRSHIRRIVCWRLSDAVGRLRAGEPGLSARREGQAPPQRGRGNHPSQKNSGADYGARGMVAYVENLPAKLNGHEASRAFYRKQLMATLRLGLGQLSARQRRIVVGLLRGQTQAALAAKLGLSAGRVSQEYGAALVLLREWMESRGFDSLDLDS